MLTAQTGLSSAYLHPTLNRSVNAHCATKVGMTSRLRRYP